MVKKLSSPLLIFVVLSLILLGGTAITIVRSLSLKATVSRPLSEAQTVSSIAVLSPNGGEALDLNRPYEIQWQADAAFSKFSIVYYKNDDTKSKKIIKNVRVAPNSNGVRTYLWNPSVSKLDEESIKDSSFRIEITSKAGKIAASDKSDALFFIVPSTNPTIELEINGRTKPTAVNAPASLVIKWVTTAPSYISSCSGTGQDWDGAKATTGGKDTIKNVGSGIYTYMVTCNKVGGGTIKSRATILVKPKTPTFDKAAIQTRTIEKSQKSEVLAFASRQVLAKLFSTKCAYPNPRMALAINIAVSLDLSRKLAVASGAGSTGTSAQPEVNLYNPQPADPIIWFNNGMSPMYGVRATCGNSGSLQAEVGELVFTNDLPGSTPYPRVNETYFSVGAAMSKDGKIFKVSIRSDEGTLNLTLDYSTDKVIWKTTGWLNSKGNMTGNNNILATISRLATARYNAHAATSKPEPQKSQQINGLFFASAMFSGSLHNAEKYHDVAAFGMASEYEMEALLDATYNDVQDYVAYSNTPTVYYIPNQVEYLACEDVTYAVPGAPEIYYGFDPYYDEEVAVEDELFTYYEIPGGDVYVTESICHVETETVYQEMFSYSTWAGNIEEARENNVVIDANLPLGFDSSFIDMSQMEAIEPGKKIFIHANEFSDEELLTLNGFDFNSVINKYGPGFREALNSANVYIVGEREYRNMNEDYVMAYANDGFIAPNAVADEINKMNSFCAYNVPGDIIVLNGVCLLSIGNLFTNYVYANAEEVILHEYVHTVDRESDGMFLGRFSLSDEWKSIYLDAFSIGKPAFVSDYAMTNIQEDFAESVVYYYTFGGNPAKITSDPRGQAQIQRRFDYLKKIGIVQ